MRNGLSSLLIYLLLVILALLLLLPRLDVYPDVWWDEGYSTHAARVLAETGVYGAYTTVEGLRPFEPMVNTGPGLIVPTALVFQLFGNGVVQARLVVVLFTLASVLMIYALAARLFGSASALLITLVVIAAPLPGNVGLMYLGRQSLGEGPALTLAMLGFLLWFDAWRRDRMLLGALAGAAFGLGVITKVQFAIYLVPTVLIIIAARCLYDRKLSPVYLAPVPGILGLLGGWLLIQRLAPPEALRDEYAQAYAEGFQTHFLTGLFGRSLSTTSWAMAAFIVITALFTGGWLIWRYRKMRTLSHQDWMLAAFVVLMLGTCVWFVLFSIGWPRYLFLAWTVSLMLAGKGLWEVIQLLSARTGVRSVTRLAMAGLVIVALISNLVPILRHSQLSMASEMAAYITEQIPPDAVIESWEWEIDALTTHWEYSHPGYQPNFGAIRQLFHRGTAFDLDYDGLRADPDYLLIGPFGTWTGIYDDIRTQFQPLVAIGNYALYARRRDPA